MILAPLAALSLLLLGGCGPFSSRSQAIPLPDANITDTGEAGVHSLTLKYALPKTDGEPVIVAWQRITIEDEQGRFCPVRSINYGKGDSGYWTSITFMFPPDARRIGASLVLRVDARDYPLDALLTRIAPTQWQIDYGVKLPPPKEQK